MISAELPLLLPEITLLALTSLILVLDTVFTRPGSNVTYWLTQLTLVIVMLMVVLIAQDTTVVAFNGNFVSDPMSAVLKSFICLITLVVFFYSQDYLREHDIYQGEFFVLGLFAVMGMMVMVSAGSLLTVYLGLELLSLSLYAMVAMHRDSPTASEAAMKYFVLGALASGMLLYGISMLYGVTGSVDLQEIAAYTGSEAGTNMLLVFGLVFTVVGIGFKLGAVPFHMWVPDVYQGAPTAVTLFISTAPKVAAFAMAMRLLVDGLLPLLAEWQGMLMILAVLSMATGNIVAISQSNIKRMLAYSTIAHIGYLMLGLLSGTANGFAGSMFYVLVYALMSMGAFGMIILLGRRGVEADTLEDFKGMAQRNPWFAFIMLILMFSMAGVPPFIGFWAKWFVIKEVVAIGHIWMAALAVVFSVIGAYYYLRIVKLMYFDQPDTRTAIKASQSMRLVLSLNGLAIMLLGFMPGTLMAVCLNAIGVR